MAGMFVGLVRLSNLTPETPYKTLSYAFCQYREIEKMQRKIWSKAYHKVFIGVKIVVITLTKHMTAEHKRVSFIRRTVHDLLWLR
jgi:hypothetical protein